MGEIANEEFGLALEATAGTPELDPTITVPYRPNNITFKENRTIWRPELQTSTYVEDVHGGAVVRIETEWDVSGAAYLALLYEFGKMCVDGTPVVTTPTDGVLTRLGTFTPDADGDSLKTATLWKYMSSLLTQRAAYAKATQLVLTNDATGEEGLMLQVTGMAGAITKDTSSPTFPAISTNFPLLPAKYMQVWLDTASIGTTELVGRVLSVQHTIPTGVIFKHYAQGPTGDLSFNKTGRQRYAVETQLVVEFNSIAEYDYWTNQTHVKCRVRHNGPLIESVGTPAKKYYHYVQMDTYGKISVYEWGDYEATNRTAQLTIRGAYDSGIAGQYGFAIQTTGLS